MLKKAVIAAVVLAVAAPGLASAKGAKKESTAGLENTAGPIPYSELAAVDAKINGTGGASTSRKHLAKKKKAAPKAEAPAAAGADASKPAQ